MMSLGLAVGRNDIPRIEALCTDALRIGERDEMALIVLADTYWRNHQPQKALSFALKALEVSPSDFNALRIAAGISAERGERAIACSFAKRLLAVDAPDYSPTKTISRFLAPFTWIGRARRLKTRAERDEIETRTSDAEWMQWAREYVARYESSGHAAP